MALLDLLAMTLPSSFYCYCTFCLVVQEGKNLGPKPCFVLWVCSTSQILWSFSPRRKEGVDLPGICRQVDHRGAYSNGGGNSKPLGCPFVKRLLGKACWFEHSFMTPVSDYCRIERFSLPGSPRKLRLLGWSVRRLPFSHFTSLRLTFFFFYPIVDLTGQVKCYPINF